MTCIVGLIDKDGVYIGGDSAAVSEEDLSFNVTTDSKVFQKGEFLFGYSSSFRMGQLLKYKLRIPIHPKGVEDFQFMVTSFVDSVKKCFQENDYNEMKLDEGSFLVGYRGKLYCVFSDYQINQPKENFAAMGCGEFFALGALFATPEKDPVKKVEVGLNAAVNFSMGVKPPFTIIKILNKKPITRKKK